MGNDNSKTDDSNSGSEMFSAKEMSSEAGGGLNQLHNLDELKTGCLLLRAGVRDLAETVDDMFDDDWDDVSSVDMETRLLAMTRHNQTIVQKLVGDLEKHAKVFDQEKNETVMAIVKEVVSSVNNYMNMLIMNIRKLKRVMSESEGGYSRSDNYGRRSADKVYDVISDSQDVDAMLLQLVDTMSEREELETDIVKTLILWKSRRFFQI